LNGLAAPPIRASSATEWEALRTVMADLKVSDAEREQKARHA
jgi:hypothetical protein